MRSLAELISEDRSAWAEIEAAVSASPCAVEILPTEPDRAASCLQRLQVSSGSWLGALVYLSGGLIVDDGWLRVFGSGSPQRGLPDIHTANAAFSGSQGSGLIVAQDIMGGEFVWRQGDPGDSGDSADSASPTVHYFAPDTLRWEDLGLGYTNWLYGMLDGALDQFYRSWRWPGWQDEVAECPLDAGLGTVPPLFLNGDKDLADTSRHPIAMTELVGVLRDYADQRGT